MAIWERFRRKKAEEEIEIPEPERRLPDELRVLKESVTSSLPPSPVQREPIRERAPEGREEPKVEFPPIGLDIELKPKELDRREHEVREKATGLEDKIEMILTKLDLLNERVKVIEEKLERRGVI